MGGRAMGASLQSIFRGQVLLESVSLGKVWERNAEKRRPGLSAASIINLKGELVTAV